MMWYTFRWISCRRFSYIDTAGWIYAVDLVRDGFWFTAVAVMFLAICVGIIVQALTEG